MSIKESSQIAIFEQLKRREITQQMGAIKLDLSERQVRNKLRAYEQNGTKSLIHGNRGKCSTQRWNGKEEKLSLDLLKTPMWKGFGPTFAAEKLKELHGIRVSKETLRKAMIRADIWHGKQHKPKHREWRERKPYFGLMVQLDGSDHDWFEGRGPKCVLLVFIDDATSFIYAKFVPSESTECLFEETRNYIKIYGRPKGFYLDCNSVYRVNLNNPEKDKLSQFGRAMKELGIKLIYALSPQAKGRVERSNRTHQDRLIKEMRLRGISSIEVANSYLLEYCAKHNARFSINPALEGSMHRSIEGFNLDNILCFKEKRVIQNNFVIQFEKRLYQLENEQQAVVRPKEKVIVMKGLDGKIKLSIRNIPLAFKLIDQRPQKKRDAKIVRNITNKPSANHPWRQYVATQVHKHPQPTQQMEVISGDY